MSDRRSIAAEFFEQYRESTVPLKFYGDIQSVEIEAVYQAFASRIIDELAARLLEDGAAVLYQESADPLSVRIVPESEWRTAADD